MWGERFSWRILGLHLDVRSKWKPVTVFEVDTCFSSTYTKIRTIQRRLALPLHRMIHKLVKCFIFFKLKKIKRNIWGRWDKMMTGTVELLWNDECCQWDMYPLVLVREGSWVWEQCAFHASIVLGTSYGALFKICAKVCRLNGNKCVDKYWWIWWFDKSWELFWC